MASGTESSFASLDLIRDRALMLSLGYEYLCEARILSKLGLEIEGLLASLSGEIRSLESKFPGRPNRENRIDGLLEAVGELARRMGSPDPSLKEQCALGELGREMEARLKSLADELGDFRMRVEGPPAVYSGREAVSGFLGSAGGALRTWLGLVAKLAGVLVLAGLVFFGYLFATMDRPGEIREDLAGAEARIQSLRRDLEGLEAEKRKLLVRLEEAQSTAATRRDKLAAMELGVGLDRMEKEQQALEGELARQEQRAGALEQRLERLEEKDFLERLLRR